MKKGEAPIALRSVILMPQWMMIGGVALSTASIAAGLGLAVFGLSTASGDELGGWLGGAFGCIFGGAGGLFGTLCDWRRRAPAKLLFAQLRDGGPCLFYRRVFWPALAVTFVCLIVGIAFGHWQWLRGFLQTGAMLAFMSGIVEAIRRHTLRQARVTFSLYADGLLDPEDAAAIDDARRTDEAFDREILEFRRVAAALERSTIAKPQ